MNEATIRYLSHLHPDATLKSDQDIVLLLKTVLLKPKEYKFWKKYTKRRRRDGNREQSVNPSIQHRFKYF